MLTGTGPRSPAASQVGVRRRIGRGALGALVAGGRLSLHAAGRRAGSPGPGLGGGSLGLSTGLDSATLIVSTVTIRAVAGDLTASLRLVTLVRSRLVIGLRPRTGLLLRGRRRGPAGSPFGLLLGVILAGTVSLTVGRILAIARAGGGRGSFDVGPGVRLWLRIGLRRAVSLVIGLGLTVAPVLGVGLLLAVSLPVPRVAVALVLPVHVRGTVVLSLAVVRRRVGLAVSVGGAVSLLLVVPALDLP